MADLKIFLNPIFASKVLDFSFNFNLEEKKFLINWNLFYSCCHSTEKFERFFDQSSKRNKKISVSKKFVTPPIFLWKKIKANFWQRSIFTKIRNFGETLRMVSPSQQINPPWSWRAGLNSFGRTNSWWLQQCFRYCGGGTETIKVTPIRFPLRKLTLRWNKWKASKYKFQVIFLLLVLSKHNLDQVK